MKKRTIQSVLIFSVIFYIITSFCACDKENPVIPPTPPPPPGPDTVSRYIWTMIHFGSYMYDVYAADTDKIFIVGNAQLLWYNGSSMSSYELYDPQFEVSTVYGYDKNNIFVAGEYVFSPHRLPIIKKITNNAVSSYTIGDTGSIINDMLVTGPNQAWFSEVQKNKVYFFNNGLVTTYTLYGNDSIKNGIFYLNPSNELFVFAADTYDPLAHGTFFTYKFINGDFVLQRTDCFGNFPCNMSIIFRCGKDAIMSEYETNRCLTKYFNGTEWVEHSFLDSVWGPFYKIGGISKDSLIGYNRFDKIYTYGGTKWRKENNSPVLRGDLYGRRTNIEMKFGNIYFTYIDTYTGGFTCFLIGRPNKNLKNNNTNPNKNVISR
jgi:hypothetical protein